MGESSTWRRRLLGFAAAFLVGFGILWAWAWLRQPRLPDDLIPAEGRYDVKILRDTWGVPHIFGTSDADTAYGLAWAHSEDDFATIQGALLATRGQLASHFGADAAPNDFMVALLRIRRIVEENYGDLPDDLRAFCEAYADGVNHYAALHPGEAIPRLYPARGQDVVAGFVHKLPLFFGLDGVLKDLFAEQPKAEGSQEIQQAHRPGLDLGPIRGSNAFAVSPRRSAGGETFLVVNSHQPWTGPVAWYEAHLRSEEGLDMVGGVFPGSPVILHGHNRRLGWAHTVNHPDLIDVYRLEIDPDDPDRYRVDGEWLELERDIARIEVKLFGPFTWTVEREVFHSVFGPTVRRPHGTYAIRFAGYGEIRQLEQWYRMNRAQDLDEWLAAMSINAIPMFHTVYADADGRILYQYNARLPLRAEGTDFSGTVAGEGALLWQETLPFEHLPRVLDPEVGFVQNCNNTPFRTTLTDDDPRRQDLPAGARSGIEERMTGRAHRALELFTADEEITLDDLLRIKWDSAYHPEAAVARHMRRALELAAGEPDLQEAADHLRQWDLEPDLEDRQTALVILAFGDYFKFEDQPSDEELLASLRQAVDRLHGHFGRLDVPWGEVNRMRRGEVDLPLIGAPDVLHAVYGERQDDGRLAGVAGDSYVLIAEWDRDGKVSSQSLHQFGSATRDQSSPHFANQAPLFARHELRPVWLDEADIRANLEREYRPGE